MTRMEKLAVLWVVCFLGFVAYGHLSRRPSTPTKDSYDDVPPITGFMQRQIDRGMLRDVWTYVQDQKAFRAQFDADLKDGKIPHLPGVK